MNTKSKSCHQVFLVLTFFLASKGFISYSNAQEKIFLIDYNYSKKLILQIPSSSSSNVVIICRASSLLNGSRLQSTGKECGEALFVLMCLSRCNCSSVVTTITLLVPLCYFVQRIRMRVCEI
jgi:hypothetical protein